MSTIGQAKIRKVSQPKTDVLTTEPRRQAVIRVIQTYGMHRERN